MESLGAEQLEQFLSEPVLKQVLATPSPNNAAEKVVVRPIRATLDDSSGYRRKAGIALRGNGDRVGAGATE
jgi:hypothetical protein